MGKYSFLQNPKGKTVKVFRIRVTLMRIRILLFTLMRIRILLFHFDADLDPDPQHW
jgi:hypothetical protein